MTATAETEVGADGATPPLALGYVRAHLLMTESELADARSDLADYAEREGFRLGTVYVEQPDTVPEAFRDLVDEIVQEEPQAILTPNALHLAVLGLPPRVMHLVYATTGVEVLLTNLPGRTQQATSP